MKRRFLFGIVGFIYLLVLGYLLFLAPFREGTETEPNLIPFKSLSRFFTEFKWHAWWYWVVNVPGNIVAFIPFPFIGKSWGIKGAGRMKLLVAFLIPSCIEFTQYIFQVGVASIDDVLLNALGFWIGFRMLRKRPKLFLPKSSQDAPLS